MREIGIVTLLSVAATAAAPTPRIAEPVAAPSATSRYAACLASSETPTAARWWIVANERGGSIALPAGARVQHAYLVVVDDQGERSEMALERAQQQRGESGCN